MANILDDTRSLRGGPPRKLNIFTQIKILFSGFMIQFGSAFFWFGMIFTLVFVGKSDLIYIFSFDGEWVETEAVIEEVTNTFAEVNSQEVFRFRFSYTVDGQNFEGTSNGPLGAVLNEGQRTRIEYRSQNPARARILGMTIQMFPVWVGFVLIFPLIGLIVFVFGFIPNLRALRLIKIGKFTRGKKIGATPTNVKVNEQTVMAYEFQFEAKNQKFIAVCKTHEYHKVEDEELEKIIYDNKNPNFNIVYDAVPGAPRIDKFGHLEQSSPAALVYMGITFAGLVINGTIFYLMYVQ